MSHDKRLISPIAPNQYGDRFIEFIEGITKSPEEAAREAAEPPRQSLPHANSNRNTTSLDSNRRRSGSQHIHRTNTSNPTIQRNENDAIRSERHGDDETDRPDPRTLGVVRSPSAERTGGLQGQTLPVVEELGEASSTGGRSGRSEERRPLTPPKDGERPLTPPKDYSNGDGRSSIGAKRPVSRSSLDKDLPPLPN